MNAIIGAAIAALVSMEGGIPPATDLMITALAVYREASGECLDAKRGVAWVIRNRVEHPSWYGKSYFEVVTKPSQFTSMVPPKGTFDPNLVRYPNPEETAWLESVNAAWDVIGGKVSDPTKGATFYFDKSRDSNPPAWAKQYTHTADLGSIHFYKP